MIQKATLMDHAWLRKTLLEVTHPDSVPVMEMNLVNSLMLKYEPNIIIDYPRGFAAYSFNNFLTLGRCMIIEEIFVHEEYRKEGNGRALFEHLENEAVNQECHGIILNVSASNVGAMKFYKKMGMSCDNYTFSKSLV